MKKISYADKIKSRSLESYGFSVPQKPVRCKFCGAFDVSNGVCRNCGVIQNGRTNK